MANALRQSFTWRDIKGNTARNRFYVSSGGTTATQKAAAQAVATAETAISNAAFQGANGPFTNTAVPALFPGSPATYNTVEDKAKFVFEDAGGGRHNFEVPAPVDTIFLADAETVDPANTDVVGFTSAVIANCTNQFGDAIAFFSGGIRVRRKLQRKLTIFVKAPDLDIPAE